jgi:hypothetical protein
MAIMVSVLILCLPMLACVGWGDMLAEKHALAADYYLMQGEDGSPSDLYLYAGRSSTSIAGPLYRIGWNREFIILTDKNWPVPWTVIDVKQHKISKITEAQRSSDRRIIAIAVLSPASAWTVSSASISN